MTKAENRALLRAAVLLLVASTVRFAWDRRSRPPVVPLDEPDVLPELLEATRAELAEAERRKLPLGEGERLDPNRAGEVELDRLPGVGPATAAAMVREREEGGGFRRPDDLLRVRGIGPATLERIRDHLELGEPLPVVGTLPPARAAGAAEGSERVDVNRADAQELEALPGVGPALAGRIVELRRRKGAFRSVDELLEVRGIGEATLEGLRERVTLGPGGLPP